ncbi:centrosomal protein of 85 kDa isoform X2 [Tiliqua scincoides]
MPSMLDRPLGSAGELSASRASALASFLPRSSDDVRGLVTSHNPDVLRDSQVFTRNHLHLNQTSVENGSDQSLFLPSSRTSLEHAQKSGRLAELPLNQSTGPWSQLQMCNSYMAATVLDKETCRGPDDKPTAEASGVCESQISVGLHPASKYSNPTALQSQVWRQEACVLHPYEYCAAGTWKQHLDHMQLQLEQMQLQNKTPCYHPLANIASLCTLDPAQWAGIVNANESLLREKEILINRQRQHISQLEQRVRESELQAHSAFFGNPSHCGDLCLVRMQELQRENMFLRAQFTEKTESLNKEKIELERKLAASEVGVKEIQEAHKETVQKHAVEVKKQEERVKARDKHIEHLKKKCQKESEQNREKQQRIETLERYVADLPMLEDHRKQYQQLKESQQAVAALQETVVTLQRDLGDVRASCREKELQLETQKRKEMELLSTVHSLQGKAQYGKTSAADDCAQEMEKQREEKNSLQKECDLLRKIIDSQKKKMDQLSLQVKDLDEQIAQEEGTSQALKAEALKQESGLQLLRIAVKELSAQNQELMEKNLTLQEQLRQTEPDQLLPGDAACVAQELHGELASCLQDLQSVFSLVTQRAQGKDPNLSLLLGIHTLSCSAKEQEDFLKPDMLATKLDDVKQLRREIEDLRTAISDHYAQDMGDNCITQ